MYYYNCCVSGHYLSSCFNLKKTFFFNLIQGFGDYILDSKIYALLYTPSG
jgi:hypothetical protein